MRMPIYALPGFRYGTPDLDTELHINHGQLAQDTYDYNLAQAKKGKLDWNKGGNIAGAAIGHVGDMMNAFGPTKSAQDLQNEAGTSSAQGYGFGYIRQNDIDAQKQMAELSRENQANTLKTASSGAALGATIGSIFPGAGTLIGGVIGGIGGLIGGLFGSSRRKRKMQEAIRKAKQDAIRRNDFNMSSAQSDYMAQSYYNEHGDTSDDQLYAAKHGKDKNMILPKYKSNNNVWTSAGKVNAEPNARVSGGESIFTGTNTDDATATVVRNGKPNADDQLANLKQETVVFGNDVNPRTGVRYKDEVLPYTNALEHINKKFENRTNKKLNKLRGKFGEYTDKIQQQQVNKFKEPIVNFLNQKAQEQAEDHAMMEQARQGILPGYKRGKSGDKEDSPFKLSWIPNAVTSGVGMASSIAQYLDAANSDVYKPDIYAANPYENAALTNLAKIRINPYPIANQMRDAERRSRYAVNRAGGLSGAQKHYANIASILGTQSNIANMMSGIQEKNNQYKSQYANALYSAGAANAQRRQAANEYAENYYAQAHAAKQQGKQVAMQNFINQLNSYYANDIKRKQFNDMMSMYRDNQKLDRDKFETWKNGLNNNGISKEEINDVIGILEPKGKLAPKTPIVAAYSPTDYSFLWRQPEYDNKPYPWYPGN